MTLHVTRSIRRTFKIRDSAVGACHHVLIVFSARCSRVHRRTPKAITGAPHRPPASANRYPLR